MNYRELQKKYTQLVNKGAFDETLELCERAYYDAGEEDDNLTRAVALVGIAKAYEGRGSITTARNFLEDARNLIKGTSAEDVQCQILCASGDLETMYGTLPVKGLPYYQEALKIAENIHNYTEQVRAKLGLRRLPKTHFTLAHAQTTQDDELIADTYFAFGIDSFDRFQDHLRSINRDRNTLRQHFPPSILETAIQHCKRTGNSLKETVAMVKLGIVYLQYHIAQQETTLFKESSVESLNKSISILHQALLQAEELSFLYGQISAYVALSKVYHYLSEHEKALFYVEEAYKLVKPLSMEALLAEVLETLAIVHLALLQTNHALKCVKELIPLLEKIESPIQTAHRLMKLASASYRFNHIDAAYDLAEEAVSLYLEGKALGEAAQATAKVAYWHLLDRFPSGKSKR
jgi:tetratricopeptide (TPR) repeat protein